MIFLFSTRLYLHVAIFSLIQNKKCILLILCVLSLELLSFGTVKAIALIFLAKAEHNLLRLISETILFLGGLGMGETHKPIVRIELVYRTIGAMLGLPPYQPEDNRK